MTSDAVRMFFRLTYLTAVLFGGAYLLAQAYHFEGLLVLAKDHAERTVVAAQGEGGPIGRFLPSMPPELLQADNPRALERALDKDTSYTSTRLPFAVTLKGVEMLEARPPRQVIEARKGKETRELPAEPGAKLAWDGGEATLRELRPWLGLLRTPNAAPMAALSLRRGEEAWTRGVFLSEGLWRKVEPDTGLLLRWWKSEDEAKSRFPEKLGPFFGARWGVVDGGDVNWFASLAPGTGATLSDDTEVTLLDVEAEHEGQPAIQVSLKPKNGPARREWHLANETGPVRLELPGRFARHVLINGWRDGAAYVAVFDHGERRAITPLNESDALKAVNGLDFSLRLDAIMQNATPSTSAKDAEVLEAILDTPAGEVALREGTMRALKDNTQVRFRRVPQPPRVRYAIEFTGRGMSPEKASLALGESTRLGAWHFTYARETANPSDIAVLAVERTAYTPGRTMGALLIFAGCYGFVIARALMRRRYSSSSSAALPLAEPPLTSTGDTDNDVN